MKESEFRKKVLDRVHVVAEEKSTVEWALALAKEAGATFEAELEQLGNMNIWNCSGNQRLMFQDGREPNIRDLTEVLRRCKAVEEAVALLRDHPSSEIDPLDAKILAILEGMK